MMYEYCFVYHSSSSYCNQFFCKTDDNLVALYLLAKHLLNLDDFNFSSYDVPCYCWIDDDLHNFTDKEISFFRKIIGLEK